MKEYEIAVPITGLRFFTIKAKNRQKAIETVLSGDYLLTDCFDCDIDLDLDFDNWEVDEL